MLERHLDVNLFGTWAVTQAFLPLLARSHGGDRQQRLDDGARARAADAGLRHLEGGRFNLTQSLRALLAGRGVTCTRR